MFQPNFVTFTNIDIVERNLLDGKFKGNQNNGFTFVTFADGSGGIQKELKDWVGNKTHRLYPAPLLSAQEYLSARVGEVINAPIRDCLFTSDGAKTVIMPFIEGKTGEELGIEEYYPETAQGDNLRLFDYLVANADRRPKNLIYTGENRIVGIDHALCNFRPRVPQPDFIAYLWNRGLTLEALLIMKPKLATLEPHFAQLGMDDKFQNLIDNLDRLIEAFRALDSVASVVKSVSDVAKSSESFTPPQGVQQAAQRALDWIKDGKAGDGFTAVGRKRASDLASAHSVSEDTLRRMKAYFDRHQPDKKAEGFSSGENGYPSPGRVAWDAWGGDAGYSWAKKMVAHFNSQEVKKGDVAGHEFHGNQWTGGNGSAEGALLTGEQVKSAFMSSESINAFNRIMTKQGYLGYPNNSPLFGGCGVVMKALQNIYPNGKPVALGDPITPEEGKNYPPVFVQHYALQIGDDKFVDANGEQTLQELKDYSDSHSFSLTKYWQVVSATPELISKFGSIATCTDAEAKDYANTLIASAGVNKSVVKNSVELVTAVIKAVLDVAKKEKSEKSNAEKAEELRQASKEARLAGDEDKASELYYRAMDLQFKADAEKPVAKGDVSGHSFHGNQWTGGIGGVPNSNATWKGTSEGYKEAKTLLARKTLPRMKAPVPKGWSKSESGGKIYFTKGTNTVIFAKGARGWAPGERLSTAAMNAIDKYGEGKTLDFTHANDADRSTGAWVNPANPNTIQMGKWSTVASDVYWRSGEIAGMQNASDEVRDFFTNNMSQGFPDGTQKDLTEGDLQKEWSVSDLIANPEQSIASTVIHELGHSNFFAAGDHIDQIYSALDKTGQELGVTTPDWNKVTDSSIKLYVSRNVPYGMSTPDGNILRADLPSYLSSKGWGNTPLLPSTQSVINSLGSTRYGSTTLQETVAESYAAFQSPLVPDTPLVTNIAEALGWTKVTKSAKLGFMSKAQDEAPKNVTDGYWADGMFGPQWIQGDKWMDTDGNWHDVDSSEPDDFLWLVMGKENLKNKASSGETA